MNAGPKIRHQIAKRSGLPALVECLETLRHAVSGRRDLIGVYRVELLLFARHPKIPKNQRLTRDERHLGSLCAPSADGRNRRHRATCRAWYDRPVGTYRGQPLHASSSEAVTHNVRVEVESQYAPEHSQPLQDQWFFYYTIRITNEGERTVQLLSRHWIITDATDHVEEVRGPGVVGEQPVLAPGESFKYSSWCPLKTPTGMMHGTYQMIRSNGDPFEIEIAPFGLKARYMVN